MKRMLKGSLIGLLHLLNSFSDIVTLNLNEFNVDDLLSQSMVDNIF